MTPFVPMDDYASQRDSMAFMEWFLFDPKEAIKTVFPSMIKSDHYSILGTTKRPSAKNDQHSISAELFSKRRAYRTRGNF